MKQVLFLRGLYDAIQACVNFILGLALPTVTTKEEKAVVEGFLKAVKLSLAFTEEDPVKTETTVTIVRHYFMNPSMITPSVSVLATSDVFKAFLMGVVEIVDTEVTTKVVDEDGNKALVVEHSYAFALVEKYNMSDPTIKFELLSGEMMLAIIEYTAEASEESNDSGDESGDNSGDDQSSTEDPQNP